MDGAVVGRGCDALAEEAVDGGGVDALCVGRVKEAAFVGEGDGGKPV